MIGKSIKTFWNDCNCTGICHEDGLQEQVGLQRGPARHTRMLFQFKAAFPKITGQINAISGIALTKSGTLIALKCQTRRTVFKIIAACMRIDSF